MPGHSRKYTYILYICVPHRYHGISDTFLHSLSIMYLFVSNLLLNIYIYIYTTLYMCLFLLIEKLLITFDHIRHIRNYFEISINQIVQKTYVTYIGIIIY